jgi:hypothetical protein
MGMFSGWRRLAVVEGMGIPGPIGRNSGIAGPQSCRGAHPDTAPGRGGAAEPPCGPKLYLQGRDGKPAGLPYRFGDSVEMRPPPCHLVFTLELTSLVRHLCYKYLNHIIIP